ncbi:MAG: hypothetical protein RBS49_00720 [Sphaerochaeta sp.]|jgi:hypothetical protein|nr:hypothetical protein [Sphaerochaeta sp.]MDX9914383.1 hypothetical protein [Sphaerochaeta sp.]
MKRLFLVIAILCVVMPGSSAGMEVLSVVPYPTQLQVHWTAVEGADYYDLYLDRVPMARVREGHQVMLGSNEQPLLSHHEYTVLVAARKDGNIEMGFATAKARTGGWEGRYRWVNETKSTNKGWAKQLDYRVTYEGGEYRIEGFFDRWYTLFPLVDPAMIGHQFAFDGEGEVFEAYRNNMRVFNTTTIKPKWWKVVSSSSTANSFIVDVRSRAGGIEVVTRSTYRFVVASEGKSELHFTTTADGVASLSIFRSPNPGENGVFKAVQI